MLALLLLACSGKNDSTPGDDSSPADDSGANIVYPKGDRILMYYGNGGFTKDIAGTGSFDSIAKLWKDQYGWNTDPYDHWPENMDAYRMIGLIAPGWTAASTFDEASVALLQAALDRGTRIVVFAEQGCDTSTPTVNALVAALGVSWTMRGKGGSTFSIVQTNAVSSGKQMTEGVSEVRMIDPCWVDQGSADILVADESNNFIAVDERPGNAGDVAFIGDINIMDDTVGSDGKHGFQKADNFTFLDNMVRVTWK